MVEIKPDQVIRSKRKTFSFEITRDARLVVKVPLSASSRLIEKILSKKRLWIQRTQKIVQEKYQKFFPKAFVDGEEFLYLGELYKLYIADDDAVLNPLSFDCHFRLSRKYLDHAKEIFIRWYKEEASKKISDRVKWFAQVAGAEYEYGDVKISGAEKRWGSCSSKGRLRFSWRLMMAPLEVIDYVVVHELVHLKEKNHSKAFWNKVESILPSYKTQAVWLKENEHLLCI